MGARIISINSMCYPCRPVLELSVETIVFSSISLIIKTCYTYFFVRHYKHLVYDELSVGATQTLKLVLAVFLNLGFYQVKIELVSSIVCENP